MKSSRHGSHRRTLLGPLTSDDCRMLAKELRKDSEFTRAFDANRVAHGLPAPEPVHGQQNAPGRIRRWIEGTFRGQMVTISFSDGPGAVLRGANLGDCKIVAMMDDRVIQYSLVRVGDGSTQIHTIVGMNQPEQAYDFFGLSWKIDAGSACKGAGLAGRSSYSSVVRPGDEAGPQYAER